MSAAVNPFTAGTWIMEPKPQNVWGIPHASWFFAMGMGGALFINRLLFGIELGRWFGIAVADLSSVALISAGGLILIADLGRPWRVLRALMNPRTSWISIGAICDFVFLALEGLWMAADFDWGGTRPLAWLPWAGSSPLGLLLQAIAGASAFVVIVYPGLVLACSPSIPFWNTALIPLQFLSFAFASAFGLALLSAAWVPVADSVLSAWLAMELVFLALTTLLFIAHLLNGSAAHPAAKLSVARLTAGDLQGAFLTGTIGLGFLAPALLSAYALYSGRLDPLVAVPVAAMTLAGNWFSKYAVIKAGVYAPFL
ncbi:MAG TPA: NrfD/PsrC family molybdoenzyme membrane anchor subunit [candidate division Zixibacteria bacterium]|nr:NrfD/PsrC family molybdoenzyme membrane anchor subunit [candidate division Zixibacteria bacterium]